MRQNEFSKRSSGQALPRSFRASDGQAALTAVLFFIFISLAVAGGFGGLAVSELRQVKTLEKSKRSYVYAEGALEDALYRSKAGKNMPSSVSYTEGDLSVTITVTDVANAIEIEARGADSNARRAVKAVLEEGTEAAFNYGIQVGDGGLHMKNSSSVRGNVFSNGPVTGENKNIAYGDVISGGADGLADGVHATGSVYAHIIRNSEIDRDAYYQVISGTTVGGVSHPGSSDQSDADLAITDATIDAWEQAATTTIISSPCPYKIQGTVTLGPAKITCNVEVENSADLTLAGPLWITGNLDTENTATIRIDPALGKKSIAIIVDDPANRTTSSKVSLENSTEFFGSGTEGSYILFISQNSSAEQGGDEIAVHVKNSASGDVLVYARHGKIVIQSSAQLREVSAYEIELRNTAQVIYQTGLANLLFESGPAGGFFIDSWKEIP
ncbi:MAG: hypothetical protein HYS44_04040 [Candidatus Niyogibacteria bacterium]|nr:hypothetical protein [Candidatus Niyogibacteria bacterium]